MQFSMNQPAILNMNFKLIVFVKEMAAKSALFIMIGHAMAGKNLQSVSYKYDFSKQEACNLQLEINTKTGAQ